MWSKPCFAEVMRSVPRALSFPAAAIVAVALVACTGETEGTPDSSGAAATLATDHAYADVDATKPFTASDRRVLEQGLDKIARVAKTASSPFRKRLATETLARIEAGDVLLGSISTSHGIDRWNMCKDFKLPICQGTAPADDDTTWLGDDALGRKLERELLGYQWGNRLYFTLTRSSDIDLLAATIVHEVDHVLNRSECDYYSDLPDHVMDGNKAFVQEYRAYVAECYFVKDDSANVETCTDYASKKLESYEFVHDLSKLLPNHSNDPKVLTKAFVDATATSAPFGRLIPDAAVWPKSFGRCPR